MYRLYRLYCIALYSCIVYSYCVRTACCSLLTTNYGAATSRWGRTSTTSRSASKPRPDFGLRSPPVEHRFRTVYVTSRWLPPYRWGRPAATPCPSCVIYVLFPYRAAPWHPCPFFSSPAEGVVTKQPRTAKFVLVGYDQACIRLHYVRAVRVGGDDGDGDGDGPRHADGPGRRGPIRGPVTPRGSLASRSTPNVPASELLPPTLTPTPTPNPNPNPNPDQVPHARAAHF